MAEWLGMGLQNLLHRFKPGRGLQTKYPPAFAGGYFVRGRLPRRLGLLRPESLQSTAYPKIKKKERDPPPARKATLSVAGGHPVANLVFTLSRRRTKP